MYTKLMHDKGLRLVGGLLGSLLMSVAINVFIVPQGLYAGGAYGLHLGVGRGVARGCDAVDALGHDFALAGNDGAKGAAAVQHVVGSQLYGALHEFGVRHGVRDRGVSRAKLAHRGVIAHFFPSK